MQSVTIDNWNSHYDNICVDLRIIFEYTIASYHFSYYHSPFVAATYLFIILMKNTQRKIDNTEKYI